VSVSEVERWAVRLVGRSGPRDLTARKAPVRGLDGGSHREAPGLGL